jgi:hypothetical protein
VLDEEVVGVPTALSPSDAVGRAVHVRVGRRQESAGLSELDDLDRSSAAARWLDRSASAGWSYSAFVALIRSTADADASSPSSECMRIVAMSSSCCSWLAS